MTRLGELGLSSYEETVYRTLLSLGRAPAAEIAEASEVPRGRIYDVLDGLEAHDVVRSRATEPRTYEAVEPAVAVDRLLAARRDEVAAQLDRYERLAAEVGSQLATRRPTESRFYPATLGSEAAVSLVEAVFADAENAVLSAMSVPYDRAAWARYDAEMAAFVDCVDSDLAIRTLVSPSVLDGIPADAMEDMLAALPNTAVRVTDSLAVTADIVDESTVGFHVPHPTDAAERLGVIEVQDDSLAGDLAALLDEAWAAATPLADVGARES